MAVALRHAAPLKPEIRLAQAMSEYESLLYDAHSRAKYRVSLKTAQMPLAIKHWEPPTTVSTTAENCCKQCKMLVKRVPTHRLFRLLWLLSISAVSLITSEGRGGCPLL